MAESKPFKLLVDNSELLAAIKELSQFGTTILQFPPSVIDRFIGFIYSRPELARIDWTATEGALRCRLKPSDGLADLLFALRAIKRNGRVVGDNIRRG